jgi:tripartite-type tricarboxylate transporter receptor subunit TctC
MYRIAFVIAALAVSLSALAQSYPARPVRFLVPYAAGGSTDVVARAVGAKVQESVGQALVIENRPGGAEILATDLLSKAPPDGYTIALISNTFAINETFAGKLPYSADKDFAPVAKLVDVPFGMFVTPGLPVNTVKEFVDYAKARPGQLNYAHVGLGTPHFLTMEWFKRLAGLDIQGIGYKGAVPALTAVAQGDVHVITIGLGGATSFVKSGKIRAIANASPRRVLTLPDLPTMKEAGYADFDFTSWFGVLAPAGTPREIVEKLNAEFGKAVLAPEVKQRLENLGLEPSAMTSAEFGRFVRSEIQQWGRVVKATGVRSEE